MGERFASITGVETNLPVGEAIPEIHTRARTQRKINRHYILIVIKLLAKVLSNLKLGVIFIYYTQAYSRDLL